MPAIVEDYAAIKRRMDELSGVRPATVIVQIDARAADGGVAELIAQAMRGFARGGIIPPGKTYIVGERAPESFVPLSILSDEGRALMQRGK